MLSWAHTSPEANSKQEESGLCVVPARGRRALCGLHGLVPPRSQGATDCLLLPLSAESWGQAVIFSSLLVLHLLWLLLGPSSLSQGKGFWFSECFFWQARSEVLLPCLHTYPKVISRKRVLQPPLCGKTLSHVELSVLNTP